MSLHSMRFLHWSLACILISLCAQGRALAVDFIRGDANGDGVVSISDAHYILSYIFRGLALPECPSTADTDDNDQIDMTDAVFLLKYLLLGGKPLPAPFPDMGSDPTDSPCASYGSGSPLDDPEARLEVLDASAEGGDSALVEITVTASNSAPIAGYSGRFSTAALHDISESFKDLTGTLDGGFRRIYYANGAVTFGFLASLTEDRKIEAGEGTPLLKILGCLQPGISPGSYPLTLEAGELVDAESGRSIHPSLRSGTLTVKAALSSDPKCAGAPVSRPVSVVYSMESRRADESGNVTVPFSIQADGGVQGYSFSVDFEEEVLEATLVEEAWKRPDGLKYEFQVFFFNNLNDHPGSGGVDEGYIGGAVVFSFVNIVNGVETEPVVMPPGAPNEALRFHFTVRPENSTPLTEIRFLDGAKGPGQPTSNQVTAYGKSYPPELATSFVFINSLVQVLPDGTLFIRGDSNGDGTVNISDAQTTLSFLFTGGMIRIATTLPMPTMMASST